MSVEGKKKSECCGCNACAEICPKHCIKMKKDYKGFYYPKVKFSECIECGLCEKACPFNANNTKLHESIAAYAAWARNRDVHLASSSGGMAFVLSDYILGKDGVVYGCAAEGVDIRHIRINKRNDLHKLQGSKYVQSDVRGLFAEIKMDLKKGISVLFVGTPCQVAGVKNYIKHIPDNLFLVDLICHGVPSQKMLESHIKSFVKAKREEVKNLSFRKGSDYILTVQGIDACYKARLWNDNFLKGFLGGLISRDSCYHCPFAQPQRIGDITIGDFWGLQDTDKFPDEIKDGISVVLPNTEKGKQFISEIKEYVNIVPRPIEEAVKGNAQLRRPSKTNNRRTFFSFFYRILPFDISISLSYADKNAISFLRRRVHKLKNILLKK